MEAGFAREIADFGQGPLNPWHMDLVSNWSRLHESAIQLNAVGDTQIDRFSSPGWLRKCGGQRASTLDFKEGTMSVSHNKRETQQFTILSGHPTDRTEQRISESGWPTTSQVFERWLIGYRDRLAQVSHETGFGTDSDQSGIRGLALPPDKV